MSTLKCLQYVLIYSLSSQTFKCLVGGIFITYPTILAVEQKADCSIVGRTRHVRCPGHVSRSLRSVTVDRWIRPLPRLSGAHQTVRCYIPESPWLRALYADCPVPHRQVLFTVQCATIALADCPLHRFLHCFFWASFVLESWTPTHLLGLLLRCCILSASVQSFLHHVNYKHKH
jgi:hypothetical protein